MSKNNIKQKVLVELNKSELPDLKFLFSDEVLECSLEILEEMLEDEKKDFEKKLKIKDKDISFDIFEDFSILDYFWSLLNHLKNINSSDKIRKIIEDFEPKIIDFGNYISFNKRYFEMLVYCRENCKLTSEQKRSLEISIKSLKTKGVNLNSDKQNELKKINKNLSKLYNSFGDNILDSENEFEYIFETDTFLKELPKEDLLNARKKAEKKGVKGYLFDSSFSSMAGVMKYCSSRDIRKVFYQARNSFASKTKHDNTKNILDIIKERKNKAVILGYENYAKLSLEYKMADSEDEIMSFIKNIGIKTKEKAANEINILKEYFKLSDFEPYDISYYSRIYKKKEFDFDISHFRKYFEFEGVLEGLFSIVKDFYGVEVKEIDPEKYNEDLKIYEIYKDGKFISYFIGDYFYRKSKDSGAWNNNLRSRFYSNKKDIKPIIVNVGSFQKSSQGKILLDLVDVETIFHEFGHALHHILSENNYPHLGLHLVEWDFVELPSQLLENWCTDKTSLKRFAKHSETGETISDSFIDKYNNLKHFGTGLMYTGYHHLEVFDLLVHGRCIPENKEELVELYKDLYEEFSIFKFDTFNKKYSSFDHVFAGGYAVGFYSYMWAEIIEADIFEEIKKRGMFDREVGERFIDTILGQGTKKPAKELFHDFMGREVDSKAFMERKGL